MHKVDKFQGLRRWGYYWEGQLAPSYATAWYGSGKQCKLCQRGKRARSPSCPKDFWRLLAAQFTLPTAQLELVHSCALKLPTAWIRREASSVSVHIVIVSYSPEWTTLTPYLLLFRFYGDQCWNTLVLKFHSASPISVVGLQTPIFSALPYIFKLQSEPRWPMRLLLRLTDISVNVSFCTGH